MFSILPSHKSIRLLFIIIFVVGCLSLPAVAESADQILEKKVTVSLKEISLKTGIDKIAEAAEVSIIYSNSKELINSRVSLHVLNKPLREVLNDLLLPFPLSYKVIDDKIVIMYDAQKGKKTKEQLLRNITGKVTDTNGVVLPGATIKIAGESKVYITDRNGMFIITNAPEQVTLQVSFIGFISKEILVEATSADLTIILEQDNSRLNEVKVVSTGYQTLPKERVTGSFSQPIKEMYNDRVSTDLVSKLDGITSGLLFNRNTTNTMNGQMDLNIRGRSTIFANDQPLLVVDNFPYSGDISNINPNDIENITILKDAAAASIWGVRAGNGVIVITTKKGKLNQPTSISFNSNVSIFQKPSLTGNPQYIGASDYIDVEQFLFKNGRYDNDLDNTTTYPFISPVVDILAQQRAGTLSAAQSTLQINALRSGNLLEGITRHLYQNAVNQQYSLILSGGDNKTSYYLSGGYDKNLSSQQKNDYNRLTVNSNIVFNPVKNLQVAVGLNYIQANTQTDNTLSNLLQGNIYPYARLADGEGNPLTVIKDLNPAFVKIAPAFGYLDWSYAPLTELGLSDNTTKNSDIRLSPSIRYTLIKGLSLEAKYQYENYVSNFRDHESQETYSTRNLINQFAYLDDNGNVAYHYVPLGGVLARSANTTTSYNARAQLNYEGNWAKNSINAIAGIEQAQTKTDGNSSSLLYGYNAKQGTSSSVDFLDSFPLNPGGENYTLIPEGGGVTGSINRIRSYFGNAAYTYDRKYTLSVSGRIDGSNYFGVATNLKSVPLWSAGGRWAMENEEFYHLSWLPVLHLRATYGYNGNLNQNLTGITTFLYSQVNSSLTNLPQAVVSSLGNPQLRWEKAGIANLGIDFALKNNAISGTFEFFIKNGKDIIGNESVAPSSGVTTFRGNFASMKGKGFDLQLTSKNINRAFQWSTTWLFSHVTDKVTKYNAPILPSSLLFADGASGNIYPVVDYPVYGIWSYRFAGLDAANGDPQGYINGQISKNYGSLVQPTSKNDLAYSGPARPQYYGGINNRFAYKGFSLSVNLSYKLGYYFRRSSLNYSSLFGSWLGGNQEFTQRWQKTGDEVFTNVPSMIYPGNQSRDSFYQRSEVTVVKGDHIRLQDISLSYTFDKKTQKGLPFNSLQIYVYSNNIGILWRANTLHLDPDYPNGYASPKSISLGLKTNF